MIKKFLLITVAFLYIIPLLIIATNSFMTPGEIERNYHAAYDNFDHDKAEQVHYAEFSFIPDMISFKQFITLISSPEYLDLFVNSFRLTLPIVALQLVTGGLAGYGFIACRFKFKKIIFCVYIVLMLLPFQTTLVSNYIIADRLHLLNTHLSIILPWGFNPFAAFIIRQSMKGIPTSILEAAQIDGAGHTTRFSFIAVPMAKGGFASLAILVFADSWAMVEQPMIFLRDAATEPLSLLLSQLSQNDIGLIFAASLFYMLPAVWVFLYGQEYFEQGIKLSALR